MRMIQHWFSVLIFVVTFAVQRSFQASLPRDELSGRHLVCTYDAVSGQDICREEGGTEEVCDYSHCYREWTELLRGVQHNASSGIVFETDVYEWSRVCDNSAIDEVEECVTDVVGMCSNNIPNNEKTLSILDNFCQLDGLTAYLNLHGVQCYPSSNDMFQCKEQAEFRIHLSIKKPSSAEDQMCMFQYLFRECYRNQLMELCGQAYLDFYDITHRIQWEETISSCSHMEPF